MCRRVISAAAEVFDSSSGEDGSASAPLVTTEDQVMPQHLSLHLSSVLAHSHFSPGTVTLILPVLNNPGVCDVRHAKTTWMFQCLVLIQGG